MLCFEGFTASGEIDLGGAQVSGRLSLSGATLTNPDGSALFADGLTVDRDMLCSEGFTAHGEVSLRGAHIGGNLVFDQARLTNPGGRALAAASLVVGKGMFCTEGFSAEGEVRLRGAHIGRDLETAGAKLRNPGGYALSAARLTVEQDMLCGTERPADGESRRFTAEGEIRLVGAHIKGTLDCASATLTNRNGPALTADGLTVEQEMFCRQGFTATGGVRLLRARIGGSLNFDTATLTNPGGHALYGDGLTVDHGLVCREGFTAHGEVSLLGAHIGAQLDFSWATLTNPGGLTLDLARLRATTVFLRRHHLRGSTSSMPRSASSPTTQRAGPTGSICAGLPTTPSTSSPRRAPVNDWPGLVVTPAVTHLSPTSSSSPSTTVLAATRMPAPSLSPNSVFAAAPSPWPERCGACCSTSWSATVTAPGWPGYGCSGSCWPAGGSSTRRTPPTSSHPSHPHGPASARLEQKQRHVAKARLD